MYEYLRIGVFLYMEFWIESFQLCNPVMCFLHKSLVFFGIGVERTMIEGIAHWFPLAEPTAG